MRSHDALADGVIPTRDVADLGQPVAAGADDERYDGMHLDVGEQDRRPLLAQALAQWPGNVTEPPIMPAHHRLVERCPDRQRPGQCRVEEPVLMPGLHALAVEALPQALPQ